MPLALAWTYIIAFISFPSSLIIQTQLFCRILKFSTIKSNVYGLDFNEL